MTEALTLITEGHVPDEVYERVRQEFSEDELAHLSLAIVAINGWNRLKAPPARYQATMCLAALQRMRRADRAGCASAMGASRAGGWRI